jgi:hypothetical protein
MGEHDEGVGTWATSRESMDAGEGERAWMGKCGRGQELPGRATCEEARRLLGPAVMAEGRFPERLRCGGALRKWSFIIRVLFRGRTSLGLYHLLYRPFPLLPLRIDFLWSIDGGFLCCVFLIGSFLGIFVQAFTSYVWNLQLWLNFVDLL